MDALMEEGGSLKGEISLYCSVTASLGILPTTLESFRTAYPGIHIHLKTGDAASAVRKVIHGEIDIAVAAMPDSLPKTLAFKPITITPLVFVAPKIQWEFSESLNGDIPWSQIPMVISEWGLARKRINSWFKNKGIQPNIYAQVSGNEAILSMVSLGCGVGIVPKLVIDKSPLRSKVTILAVKPALHPYHVGICIRKKKIKSPLIRAFWDLYTT
jgi:LysR family positive regulator for ilvC